MPNRNHTQVITSPYADTAHGYLAAGWRGILPLPTAQKSPVPAGYTGKAGGWPSPADIQTWIDYRPDLTNIALRLPENIIGIDVDAYGNKPGQQTLTELQDELGPLPDTVMSTSRTDGISGIRLYRAPAHPSWANPGPGIEIIHYGWRYLVVWPSIHNTTGNTYRWITTGGEILDGPPDPNQIADLPDTWVERLAGTQAGPDKASTDHQEVRTWIDQLPPGPPCKATLGALADFHQALDDVTEHGGSRHDATLRPVGALVRAGERRHAGIADALTEARTAFLNAVTQAGVGQRTTREAEAEWRRHVAGAYAIVKADPTPELHVGCRCTDTPDLTPLETDTDNVNSPDATSWAPVNPTPFLDGTWQPPQPTQLVRDDGLSLLYPGRINLLFGESEVGKGWVLLYAIAQALVRGETVLYIDFEDYPDTIYSRLLALGCTRSHLARQFAYIRPDASLDTNGRQALGDTIRTLAPALAIVDGVTGAMSLHGLDTNSSTDVDQFYSLLAEPIAATGTAVTLVDHIPKSMDGRSKGPIGSQHKRARVSGASYEIEVVKRLAPGRAGTLRIKIDKDRLGAIRQSDPTKAGMFHMDATDPTRIGIELRPPEQAPVTAAGEFRPTYLMEQVSRFLETIDEASTNTIYDAIDSRKEYVKQAIDRLVQEGFVTRDSGPRNSVIHSLEKPFRDHDRSPTPGNSTTPVPDRSPGPGNSAGNSQGPDTGPPFPTVTRNSGNGERSGAPSDNVIQIPLGGTP